VLFDLPQVVEEAKKVWTEKRAELLPRTDFVGGSFFEAATVPVARADSRDVYVLRVVLHDWSDAKTLEILANVRSAIGASKNATLAIVEGIPAGALTEQLAARTLLDIQMLVMVDGKERTQEDWKPLLTASAFEFQRVYPTRSFYQVLVAKPV